MPSMMESCYPQRDARAFYAGDLRRFSRRAYKGLGFRVGLGFKVIYELFRLLCCVLSGLLYMKILRFFGVRAGGVVVACQTGRASWFHSIEGLN